ncbi:SEC-C metal-binding domain-containing protein [Streptomyces sp. NPDC005374]|uniref:SEC-C metal-binding domain-containing protein n=1 Tax=Streptomyces sp. NPDC005374 TaxID=3364713 RepID=UPI0036C76418
MTNLPVRTFPDEAAVDDWIAANVRDEAEYDARTPVAVADQVKAATRQVNEGARVFIPRAVASGAVPWGLTGRSSSRLPGEDAQLRAAVRMYLAAESVGLRPLCEHTGQIRPMTVMCDPPVVVCVTCSPLISRLVEKIGFFWEGVCDECGRRSPGMYAAMITMGHFMISGNICSTCHDRALRVATEQADHVVFVGRKRPCPCGSGRRFKHCCGKNQDPSARNDH